MVLLVTVYFSIINSKSYTFYFGRFFCELFGCFAAFFGFRTDEFEFFLSDVPKDFAFVCDSLTLVSEVIFCNVLYLKKVFGSAKIKKQIVNQFLRH